MKIALKMIIGTFILSASLYATDAPTTYPEGEVGKMVKLGEELMNHTDTHPLVKDKLETKLQCKNCHLPGKDGKTGTTDNIGTFIGTAAAFPSYSSRHKRIQTMQERIDGCFIRCMNGKESIVGTKAGLAMSAYIAWLSTGEPMKMNTKGPRSHKITKQWETNTKKFAKLAKTATHDNYLSGKKLYAKKCALCHGKNGEGVNGKIPLWGKDSHGKWTSYGADGSMSKLHNSATWIQSNMPPSPQNTMSDQDTMDITIYMNTHQRASYKGFTIEDNYKQFGLDMQEIITGEKNK